MRDNAIKLRLERTIDPLPSGGTDYERKLSRAGPVLLLGPSLCPARVSLQEMEQPLTSSGDEGVQSVGRVVGDNRSSDFLVSPQQLERALVPSWPH